ncbi:MAG: hypothetical protein AAF098_04475 [Pseudomonadota bacterium]
MSHAPLAHNRVKAAFDSMAVIVGILLLAACSTRIDPTALPGVDGNGMYVLAYAKEQRIRRAMEDRLVSDLQTQGITAYASHRDLPSFGDIDRGAVLAAAKSKNALAILLVNRVIPGQESLLKTSDRITPEHPNVKAFFEYTRDLEVSPAPDSTVLVEVSGFLLEGDSAKLVWSGTTWSFNGDGSGGALVGISTTISDELGRLKRAFPTYR